MFHNNMFLVKPASYVYPPEKVSEALEDERKLVEEMLASADKHLHVANCYGG